LPLRQLGCDVLELPANEARPDVVKLLEALGRKHCTNVLVEGGARALGSFLDAGSFDEVHVFLAPKLAGGGDARTPAAGRGIGQIAEAVALPHQVVTVLDGDVYLQAWR
jgi:diaminohydroxyphosphoribosylaminopyrimidine deaminase/5-amino-6-(5-phosphoribosylamino)uracil reductase